MPPQIHLRIAGGLLLALASAHITFPKRFRWKEELARLSPLNRQMFLVHVFFIVLILVMLGVCSLFFADALLQPGPLSRVFLTGVTLFWLCRLFVQLFVYDRSLWRGNRLNLTIHVLLSCLWVYLIVTYAMALRQVWE